VGTGKTFMVRTVIAELARRGKKCLVTGTTDIAAAQYRGATTLDSLFKLGIDDARDADFRWNIGRGTYQADLLQLPPVIQASSMPVLQRLITRLSCWESFRKFRLQTPVRTVDPEWSAFLMDLAKGNVEEGLTWGDLAERFRVVVTDNPERAADFFCDGVAPGHRFPLDCLWISSVNRLASEINNAVQEWRRIGARQLGNVYASTELITPLPEIPGFSRCHQIALLRRLIRRTCRFIVFLSWKVIP
jgi:hypothetical protein